MEDISLKRIVCYSGGHSSAIVAIEVARKYGTDGLVLLNHDISAFVENEDVKRFKKEVADYIGKGVTFANIGGLSPELLPDQFDVCVKAKAFKVQSGQELCTNRLKTAPFMAWLEENADNQRAVIYYGFDANEMHRVQRRSQILGGQGWRTDYPLALWKDRTITSTNEIGISPPMMYEDFRHANCTGCLKAGKQHWYIVYCKRQDVWEKAKHAEEEIGFSILPDQYLYELEPVFEDMKRNHIPMTEHIPHQEFWAGVRRAGIDTSTEDDRIPCVCIF
jgi:hypothetical protein